MKREKKPFPDEVTKKFIFAEYGKQDSIKEIRNVLKEYNNILGFNIRKRILDDIVVIMFLKNYGFPENYKISSKIEMQFKKLGILIVEEDMDA